MKNIFPLLNKYLSPIFNTRAAGLYILLFAISIAIATFVENDFGTSSAQKVIFKSWWFELLLLLFCITILVNIFKFRMVQQKKWAILLFHAAIVVIIIGAGVTRYFGFEGIMHIRENNTSNSFLSSNTFLKFNVTKNGETYNFNEVFHLSTGEYFKWSAHDDICAPTYLEECEKVLTQDDSIILCHSDVRFIDEKSDIIYNDYKPLSFANSKYPSKRFKELIDLKHWCIDIFGLIRKEALNQTSLIQNFVGSDRNLLVELGLIGRFYRIPEELFYHREHIDRSTHTKTIHDRIEWWSPELSKRYHMPHWQMFLKNFKSIKMFSNLPIEPLKCYLALLDWLLKYWRKLYWDVKVVARNTLQNS